jgi:N-acetyl-alpha-D-muramate 1-phosphate uridylyltransferase
VSRAALPLAILAGGLAIRLRPLTEDRPKALVEVAGEPFIAHQLRLLRGEGIREVVVCAGYLGEMIEQFVQDGRAFALNVRYSYDWPDLLGTAGALKKALPLLGEAFFVLYGDSLLPCRYAPVQEAFVASGKPGLMTVFRNEGQWDASNVELDGGRIAAYDKVNRTSAMRHIDYGLGVLSSQAIADIETPCDLASVYQRLLAADQLAAYEVHERFYEVGSLAGIEETARYLESRRAVH